MNVMAILIVLAVGAVITAIVFEDDLIDAIDAVFLAFIGGILILVYWLFTYPILSAIHL